VEVKLKAIVREKGKHSAITELRDAGLIPGTYYGKKIEAISIYVNNEELREALHTDAGSNVLIELDVQTPDGVKAPTLTGKQVTIIKEMQRNPIRGDILHVDFVKVSMTEEITAAVPVVLSGEAPGVKVGGVLQHSIREVNVKCLPALLPDSLGIDVGTLEIGDSLHVSDLPVTEGVEIVDDLEEILVSVVPPTKVEEVVVEEGEEIEGEEEELEPEVIGEKKEEEEKTEE
jgi:large subunit ribosomal protein L25